MKAAFALSKEQRIDELAKALLREYMHRKGYKKTLAAFDEENPRSESTISSRLAMNETMALGVMAARNKATRNPPYATIMEMLCAHRLRKRNLVHQKAATSEVSEGGGEESGAAGKPTVCFDPNDFDNYNSSDEEAALEGAVTAHRAAIEARKAENEELVAAGKKKKKKDKEQKKDKEKKKDKSEKGEKKKKAGGLDPALEAAKATVSSLPIGKDSSAALQRGSGWVPGANIHIPEVGLGSGGGDRPLEALSNPPSFLAGSGMHLSTDRVQADPSQQWEGSLKDRKGSFNSGSGSGSLSPESSFREDPALNVSPDHFKKLYNPNAKSEKGVLSSRSGNMQGVSFAAAMAKDKEAMKAAAAGKGAAVADSPGGTNGSSPTSNGEKKGRRVKILVDDP